LRLTITKRNHKPYCVNIPCVENTQMVAVSDYSFDDDNAGGTSGNSDGSVNPGETIDIPLTLANFGTATTATSVSVNAICGNLNIEVVQATATFADIAPGASAGGDVPLRISISPTMKHDETAHLEVSVITSSSTTTSVIELNCVAGQIDYQAHSIAGTPLEPGATSNLQVTILNSGQMPLEGTLVNLVSLSSFVSIAGTGLDYGDIVPGATAINATPFSVTANILAYPGHQAPILIIAETSEGYIDTSTFVLPVGSASPSDPAGPDGYGYFAYDNTDIDYELHPDYNYIDISSGLGTDLNINDVGEKTSIDQLWAESQELPFPFTYYGISYDSITVCSNGWMAFGEQSWNDCFRDYPIPAINAPSTMIAPYWDDLKTSNENQGVWTYYDQANHRFVIQWKAGGGSNYSQANLNFQVVLYDTSAHSTIDGNGKILFQYNDVQMNLNTPDGSDARGCSIGIQDHWGTTGLNYAFQSRYSPGAANVVDGRAILFTTDGRNLSGSIEGTVTDSATGEPMEDVLVNVVGTDHAVTTDHEGFYRFESIIIGTHDLRATQVAYNDAIAQEILVEEDITTIHDFEMLHPEMRLSADSISLIFPPIQLSSDFEIINDGNGPLDCSISVNYVGDGEPLGAWDLIEEIDVTGETGNSQIMGCEFAGDYWFVSASGAGGDNLLYRYGLNGDLQGSIVQPTTSVFGWFDMAWDGQYVYGGESGSTGLTGIDLNGVVQTTIPSPLNPSRAIAYDPATDHFWVSDLTQDFYEIDRDGTIVSRIENDGEDELHVTGLAWYPRDPDGYKLIVFSQDGTESLTRVTAIHPAAELSRYVTTIVGEDGDRAGGCTITKDWNSVLFVFGGIQQNTNGDRLRLHQIDFDSDWITVSPLESTVEGNTAGLISLGFDMTGMRDETYRIALSIYNDVLDTALPLPIILNPVEAIDPDNPGSMIPAEYALYQNYPNPFNPSTTIEYDLSASGRTILAVYNLVGQEVVKLMDGYQQAGRHSVQFEASSLSSGLYFYQLRSGEFTATVKMVLMK